MKRPLVGILLVFVNLMCDGFTNAKQDELNRKYVALLRAAIRLHALVLSTMLASVNPGHCAFCADELYDVLARSCPLRRHGLTPHEMMLYVNLACCIILLPYLVLYSPRPPEGPRPCQCNAAPSAARNGLNSQHADHSRAALI